MKKLEKNQYLKKSCDREESGEGKKRLICVEYRKQKNKKEKR